MRTWLGLALAATASATWAAGPADSGTPAPATSLHAAVIRQPEWDQTPGPSEFARYYPKGASGSGEATIRCSVTEVGRLANCVVVSEFPEHQGFGPAALKIAAFFKMKPTQIDGQPVAGGTFSTRFRFNNAGLTPH